VWLHRPENPPGRPIGLGGSVHEEANILVSLVLFNHPFDAAGSILLPADPADSIY